ncbi:hypothetical protein BJ166DRAFT_612037 [Pestalotiopsis sp. NC0098]|nr:hypothetical protein BJ166DRAFT_612037 [Pestalotiopsis sp. NC0098]
MAEEKWPGDAMSRDRDVQIQVHQIKGLAFKKLVNHHTVRRLLLSYPTELDDKRGPRAGFERTVSIIFDAINWFFQARAATWFGERLQKELKLHEQIRPGNIWQIVNCFCGARQAYQRQHGQAHDQVSPTTDNPKRQLVEAVDQILRLEEQDSLLPISEQELEDIWAAKAATWPRRFLELLSQSDEKPNQPSERHTGVVLPQRDSLQPKSPTSLQRQSAGVAVRAIKSEEMEEAAAPGHLRVPHGAIGQNNLGTDSFQSAHEDDPAQALHVPKQEDENSEDGSAVRGRAIFQMAKDHSVSSATVRALQSDQNIESSNSIDSPRGHVLDQHGASQSDHKDNRKHQAPPTSTSRKAKRQKRNHDMVADTKSSGPDSFHSSNRLSRPENRAAINTPNQALPAKHPTKEEADGIRARFQHHSQRLGEIEAQSAKAQRVLHGEAAESVASREHRSPAPKTSELHPILRDASAQLRTTRRLLRDWIRREEETPEGMEIVGHIAEVVSSLRTANRCAKNGIKALRETTARHGNV